MSTAAPPAKRAKTNNDKNDISNNSNNKSIISTSPVTSVNTDSPTRPIYLDSDDNDEYSLLDDLFSPVPDFLSSYFCQRALHVVGTPLRAQALCREMFDLDISQIMRATASDNIFVWLNRSNGFKDLNDIQIEVSSDSEDEDNDDNNDHDEPSESCDDNDFDETFAAPVLKSPPKASNIRSLEVPNAKYARRLYEKGNAMYCRANRDFEKRYVTRLMRETGLGGPQTMLNQHNDVETEKPLARGEVELFMSPSPNTVTDWHYDFQENFTVQLSGSKKWTLQHSTVSYPLGRACTPHYDNSKAPDVIESQLKAARLVDAQFQFGRVDHSNSSNVNAENISAPANTRGPAKEIVMNAGDVLYFPSGMWHKVQVVEPGMSLNISLMGSATYASVACQAIQHILHKNIAWRQPIVHNAAHDATAQMQQLLQELPGLIQQELRLLNNKHNCNFASNVVLPPTILYGALEEREIGKKATGTDQNGSETTNKDETTEKPVFRQPYINIDDMGIKPQTSDQLGLAYTELCKKLDSKQQLFVNPLATVICKTDITKHLDKNYTLPDSDVIHNRDKDDKPDNYVINISYGDTEAQVSMVNCHIQDYKNVLQRLIKNKAISNDEWRTVLKDEEGRKFLNLLVYHGYLAWSDGS